MKRKSTKKTISKLCSYLLTVAMVVGGLTLSPITTVEVQAAPAEIKNVNLNVGNSIAGIGNPTSRDSSTSWEGTTVYYGNREYYVLDKDGSALSGNISDKAHSSLEGHMLLLLKGVIDDENRTFDDISSDWTSPDCDIRNYLNGSGFYNKSGEFTTIEKRAIGKTLINKGNTESRYSNYPSIDQSDPIFLLDIDDVKNNNYGFIEGKDGTRQANQSGNGFWWLRSPGLNGQNAARVNSTGQLYSVGSSVTTKGSARPAFNLILSEVLFSYASRESKPSSLEKSKDAMYTEYYSTWNLTLKDGNSRFNVKRMTAGNALTAGSNIEVKVTDVGTPGDGVTYTQISAMLVDSTNTVLAYGKISDN